MRLGRTSISIGFASAPVLRGKIHLKLESLCEPFPKGCEVPGLGHQHLVAVCIAYSRWRLPKPPFPTRDKSRPGSWCGSALCNPQEPPVPIARIQDLDDRWLACPSHATRGQVRSSDPEFVRNAYPYGPSRSSNLHSKRCFKFLFGPIIASRFMRDSRPNAEGMANPEGDGRVPLPIPRNYECILSALCNN
jgi:hypothetical protein